MTLCNNAFVDLASRMDDILGATFELSPRGDLKRVAVVANQFMELLSNSLYSLTWVNMKYYLSTHPNVIIDENDKNKIAAVS